MFLELTFPDGRKAAFKTDQMVTIYPNEQHEEDDPSNTMIILSAGLIYGVKEEFQVVKDALERLSGISHQQTAMFYAINQKEESKSV